MIEKIANMMGLELEEEFTFEGRSLIYKFTKDGLQYKASEYWTTSTLHLNEILTLKVVKQPWKPKIGDRYYTIILDSLGIRVSSLKYGDDPHDARLANLNIVFKTESEAQAELEKLKGFLKS
jgi:hypothetical protein